MDVNLHWMGLFIKWNFPWDETTSWKKIPLNGTLQWMELYTEWNFPLDGTLRYLELSTLGIHH